MGLLYRRIGGELCPVFPGETPEKASLCHCSTLPINPEILTKDGHISLEKFSEVVRKQVVPRIVLDAKLKPMRIAICGNKDAGKDKLAQCVKSMMPKYSIRIASISQHALLPLMLQTFYGDPVVNLYFRDHSHEARDLCRQFWYDAGASITAVDPSFLIRYAIREKDELTGIAAMLDIIKPEIILVTGIRGSHELDAAMSEGLLDFSVFVARKGTADATNQINATMTDVVFNNSGTVHDMRERVSRLVRSLLTSAE